MTADLGPASAPAASFGALLRRLREAREATIVREYHGTPRIETRTLSKNELARRAGVDVSYISRLERGVPTDPRAQSSRPSVFLVQHLAAALELGDDERAALLVAAGYWPWPDLDQDTADLLIATALAIVDGDWRPVGAQTVEHVQTR